MFGRFAAWGLAAGLIAYPAATGIESGGTVADMPSAAAAVQPADQASGKAAAAEAITAAPSIAAPALAEPFGRLAMPVSTGDVLTKWTGVESDIRAEQDILARCRNNKAANCPAPARNFLAIVAAGSALTGRARIGVINRAINLAIEPMSDLAQWGVPDRWSAPLDTFATHRGDCEDYAIAKYVALTEAGISADDVRLVIVRNVAAAEDHAVAAVRLDGSWLVLDNRWLALVDADAMPQVVPLFVLDNGGVRQFAGPALADARGTPTPGALGY
jgi:predicted transglutaminase-like cysteine proteinase